MSQSANRATGSCSNARTDMDCHQDWSRRAAAAQPFRLFGCCCQYQSVQMCFDRLIFFLSVCGKISISWSGERQIQRAAANQLSGSCSAIQTDPGDRQLFSRLDWSSVAANITLRAWEGAAAVQTDPGERQPFSRADWSRRATAFPPFRLIGCCCKWHPGKPVRCKTTNLSGKEHRWIY